MGLQLSNRLKLSKKNTYLRICISAYLGDNKITKKSRKIKKESLDTVWKKKFLQVLMRTVRLTSIHLLQIEAKSHVTAAGLTNLFMVAVTSLSSELVNAIIKKVMAPLEVGPTFGFN